MHVSCIEAHRYGGTEPTIRLRLGELGYSHLCDVPSKAARSAFGAVWKDGRCTSVESGDVHRASFEYTASVKYGAARKEA